MDKNDSSSNTSEEYLRGLQALIAQQSMFGPGGPLR